MNNIHHIALAFIAFWFLLTGSTIAQTKVQAKPSAFQLVKLGYYDQARQRLAETEHRPYHKHYLEGQIALRSGDLELAEKHYRAALEINPNFTAAKRKLAYTLYKLENYDGARYHFEALAENTNNENERQSFNQFLNAIDAKRPYGISGYFGFLPSTNFNRGSDNAVTNFANTLLDEDSLSQSGIGVTLGLSGYFRHDLVNKDILLFSGSLGANLYEQDQFNSALGSITAEFGKRLEAGRIFFGLTARFSISDFSLEKDFANAERSNVRYGLSLRGSQVLDQKNRLSYRFSALRQEYHDLRARDGYFYSSFVNWKHKLDDTKSLNLGGGISGEDTERTNLTYTNYRVRTAFTNEWKGGLSTTFRAGYDRKEYNGVFPGISENREDDQYLVGLTLLHPKLAFKGFAPRFSYTYTVQESNVSFQEYDSHDFSVIWTKKF